MNGYCFTVNKASTRLSFINHNSRKERKWNDRKFPHYGVLHRLINFMRTRGFEIGRDPYIEKNYKLLTKDRWYGRKDDLEFKAERYPNGFKIEFFQNINYENPNGGYHDFNKLEKMPYLIKLMYINETNKISEFLEELGIENKTEKEYKSAEDKIKNEYVKDWNHPQNDMEFSLSDLDGETEKRNNIDRDNKEIFNGEIKYFRDWNGRLSRGKVYHNINNMWWVITNKSEYRNIADFKLFDATENDLKIKRKVTDRKPKEYLERIENVELASTKELINELKRRGNKIQIKEVI